MDMVFAFEDSLWFAIIGFYVILLAFFLVVLLHLAQATWERQVHCVDLTADTLVACVLRQHSSLASLSRIRSKREARVSVVWTTYTLLTLTSFLVTFYLTSMIKTEMVVYKRPDTVESLQELLDSNRRPNWFKVFVDADAFRHAAKGSLANAVWQKALSMDPEHPPIIESKMNQIFYHAERVRDGRRSTSSMTSSSRG